MREAFSLTDAGSDIRQDLEELQMRNKKEKAGDLSPKEAEQLKKDLAADHAKAQETLARLRADNPEYLKGVGESTGSQSSED